MKKLFVAIPIVILAVLGWLFFMPQEAGHSDVPGTAGWQTYSNGDFGFEVKVPPGFTARESYFYHALGPGKEIPGIAFDVPKSFTEGTNLSADSGVRVEQLSRAACAPADFLLFPSPSQTVRLRENEYSYATSSDAGAGNFYEESIYVHKSRDVCYGVRFFIHSTNIANYDPGTVRQFDREALLSVFRAMVSTIRFI